MTFKRELWENKSLHIANALLVFAMLIPCLLATSCVSHEDSSKYVQGYEVTKEVATTNEVERTEFYAVEGSLYSSTGWGFVCKNGGVKLYQCSKKTNSKFIEDKTQLELLEYVLDELKDSQVESLEISIALLGLHGIEISNAYQNSVCYDNKLGIWKAKTSNSDYSYLTNQPIYDRISKIMQAHGYKITSITADDAYPCQTKTLKENHLVPDTLQTPSSIWDFRVSLSLSNVKS